MAACHDVQSHVVELAPAAPAHRLDVGSAQLVRKPLEVGAETHRAQVAARVRRRDRIWLEPRLHVLEADPLEPLGRLLGACEVPRPPPAGQVGGVRLLTRYGAGGLVESLDVPLSPHWATSLPPGAIAAWSRANRASWSAIQWKTAFEKAASTGASSVSSVRSASEDRGTGRVQCGARVLHHRRGRVDCHHVPAGQALEQHPRDPAGAASGVEHGLVALERQPLEHGPRPLDLRRGDTVIGRGVPVACHRRERRRDRSGALALGLVALDRVRLPEGHADVVEALEQPALRLRVDLEPAPPPPGQATCCDARSIDAWPAAISARTSSSASATGSRPIFVQFE